jgi:hypothetical protein
MRKSVVAEKRRVQTIQRYYDDLRRKYGMTETIADEYHYASVFRMGNYDNFTPNTRRFFQHRGGLT